MLKFDVISNEAYAKVKNSLTSLFALRSISIGYSTVSISDALLPFSIAKSLIALFLYNNLLKVQTVMCSWLRLSFHKFKAELFNKNIFLSLSTSRLVDSEQYRWWTRL